jgi:hypothetical protein
VRQCPGSMVLSTPMEVEPEPRPASLTREILT